MNFKDAAYAMGIRSAVDELEAVFVAVRPEEQAK
jgi:hypothetical protein